MKRNRMKV